MNHGKPRDIVAPTSREGAREYLFDMIAQLARLARDSGEQQIAIHLEAIIAARLAIPKDQSA
jgi:hypothetical protein